MSELPEANVWQLLERIEQLERANQGFLQALADTNIKLEKLRQGHRTCYVERITEESEHLNNLEELSK